MKILHINSYFNGSSFFKNLYDKQIEDGLEIDVFVPISSNLNDSSQLFGDYTTISKNHSEYDRPFFHFKHLKIYKDLIKRYQVEQYSITHAHSLFSNGYIAYKLKKHYGIQYIVAVRNTDVNIFFKKMIHLRKLGVNILEESKNVVFLSESYRNKVVEKYVPEKLQKEILDKSVVIPNGIDDFWFENLGLSKGSLVQKNLNLLYVGAIDENKNLLTTVEAIKILQKKGFNIKYTIVGKVKDESIYNSVKDLTFVKYITPQLKEKLIHIYRTNDIFVMPSITETFGLVYAEAMSQGLPVIYSKGQGFDGQFPEGEIGYHVNSFDAEEIANKICEISSEYSHLSVSCINKVVKFKWRNLANEYLKLYLKE